MKPRLVAKDGKPESQTPTSTLVREGDELVMSTGKRARVLCLLWVNDQAGVQVEQPGQQFAWEAFFPLAQVEHYLKTGAWKNTRSNGWAGRKP